MKMLLLKPQSLPNRNILLKNITAIVIAAGFSLSTDSADETQREENNTPHYYAERGKRFAEQFPGLKNLCEIDKPLTVGRRRRSKAPGDPGVVAKPRDPGKSPRRSQRAPLPPLQVFDNLYFIGTGRVASWAIATTEGIILIDALNNDAQAEKYIVGGLKALGLDPTTIKYLIVTHGHGDHYGGQNHLVSQYRTRVMMSAVEWRELAKPSQLVFSPRWGKPPKQDIAVQDGDVLQLGDSAVHLYLTPSHTPGTLTLMFEVFDKGKKHRAMLWGGTGLNFGPNTSQLRAYSQSAERMRLIAKSHGVDIFLSNHPGRDRSNVKMQQLPQRGAKQPHPFVIGGAQVGQGFELLRDCTYAHALNIEQQTENKSRSEP